MSSTEPSPVTFDLPDEELGDTILLMAPRIVRLSCSLSGSSRTLLDGFAGPVGIFLFLAFKALEAS